MSNGGSMAKKYWILGTLFPALVILDQWTKQLIHARFRLHESIPVIEGLFNITYVRNTGAAFGMLADANPAFRVPFFIIVPLIALGSIGLMFHKLEAKDLRMAFSLTLVLSGAIGNLIDRLIYGFVIDFLSFYNASLGQFPAFNVADSAITVGVGLLMIDMLRNPNAFEPKKN